VVLMPHIFMLLCAVVKLGWAALGEDRRQVREPRLFAGLKQVTVRDGGRS